MFLIKKFLTPFLVPPGLFVAGLFAAAAFRWKKDRGQAALLSILALLLWAAGLGPVGNRALAGLEYAYLPPSEAKADAIIVLGAGIQEGSPDGFGGTALTALSMSRAVEAFRIYRKYRLPLVATGGTAFSRGSEAAAIKAYLVSLGVPAASVFIEERARDTRENALFTKQICDEKGFRRIILVTSAYHMRRSVWTFKRAGFAELVPWPAGYESVRNVRSRWLDYLPGSYDPLRKACQERLGLLFYRLTM